MADPNPIAVDICKDFEQLQGSRGNWESHWREIAERIAPSQSTLFQSQGQYPTQGDKRTQNLFDSTAAIALNRFGAILDSMLTPRNAKWHRLIPSDSNLRKDREVRLYFDEATRIVFKYRYAPKANFASQNQRVYKSLGSYGTGSMFIDQLRSEPGIRYRNVHLAEQYISENHQGIVDKLYRYFPMKARQLKQMFGEEVIGDKVKAAIEKNSDQDFMVLHCVKPREDYDPRVVSYKGMPFASYYVLYEDKTILSEGGYNGLPYAISRYDQEPGEVYGRSPAMDVLPAIKTLNEEKKTLLKQGHRAVDPVLLLPDDGVMDMPSLKPGAANWGGVTSDGKPLVHALPTGRVDIAKEMMDDERMVINDAFLVTLFQILVETPTMTATEVLERTREKGILLAPTIGRQQSEYLGPTIEREIDVLSQQGLLPPMPPLLREAQGEYRVEYDSPLSRAQRAEEAAGLMRTVEMALNAVNITQDPAPLDHINWDVAIPEIADIQAVPERWVNSAEQVQAIRQGRAQQQQIAQATQAAPGLAAVMKASAATAPKAGAGAR